MSEFAVGTYVSKKSGAFWEGTVVGHYSTEQTPDGVAVQLFGWSNGPVQIYPAAALELCNRLGRRLPPPPTSHVAPSDTVTIAEHMKDFEAFVVATAPKLHWKVYQDLGEDPTLSKGYYDGWQHGFGEEVLGPLPIPQLMKAMKEAVRAKVAALATTEGSTE